MNAPADLLPAIVSLGLLITGLSYLLQTRRWVAAIRPILAEPERFYFGALVLLAAGIAIGLGHNDWTQAPDIFITAFGWLMALEAAVFLLATPVFRAFNRLSDRFLANYIRMGGVIFTLLGLWLCLQFPGS